ncbi:MAG: VWA domain-containing protein [Acidobacteria bacterium]|nr:VWA domain-containing protein [Acidobacteriota bacterium]
MRKRTAPLLPLLLAALLAQQQTTPAQQTQQTTPAPQPAAQQPQATPGQEDADNDDEVVRITTNLVQVDAVVTDRDGKQVTNLSAEDFEVVENGSARQITNFSYVRIGKPLSAPAEAPARRDRDAKGAPPVPPARLRPEQVRRTFALVLDDLSMTAESTYYARRAVKKYIDEQIEPGDMVAVIRTSASIGALQQFTNDRQQLYRAVERIRWSPRRGGAATALERTLESSNPASVPGGVDDMRSQDKDYDEYRQERFTVGTMGSLQFVVRGLREMPGRKAVILFSDGFPLRDSKGDATRYTTALERLIDLANRSSVVFYGIDARGLQPIGPFASDNTAGSPAGTGLPGGIPTHQMGSLLSARSGQLFATQEGLIRLSEATGGVARINHNNLGRGIQRALDDMSGYYLIGYRPDESAFDPQTGRVRFNSLKVNVKGHPELTVRSRTGYIGHPESESQPRPQTREGQLMAALISPFGAAGVNVRLTSFFINAPGGGPVVRSMLLIDPRTLTFERQPDGQQATKLDIVAVTYGEDGRIVDQMNRVETIRVPEGSLELFKKEGMVYDLNVPVRRPGAYQLRIAVRDTASERTGSASQYVEVPDLSKKRLALSGIVVASPAPQAAAQVVPAALTEQEAAPATRRFRRGALLDYGFVIYNAKADKATGRPQLTIQARLFREGQPVYEGQPQPFDAAQQTGLARIEAAGRLQLGAALEPGEYVLQLVVTDALAGKSNAVTTQWIDFELVN